MRSFVVEESLNSVRVFWLEQDKLIGEIRRVAMRVGEEDENVRRIILFGSLAEGRAFTDRIEEWLGRFSLDFPVEVFPYAEEEHNPVVEEAMKKGVVMFERM